jgi:dihydropteroate synthase
MSEPIRTATPAPEPIRAGNLTLRLKERPYIMGILNVTPDSFSDGGRYFDRQAAIDHALAMVEQGADILDVGGESTRPGSDPLPAQAEIERVLPVIEALAKWVTAPISIDTTKAPVAEAALEAGAAMINDVSALRFDPDMAGLAARTKVPLVLMHMRGVPRTMQSEPIVYQDLMGEIRSFLQETISGALRAGVREHQIIVDPGIGFGKTAEHNLMILNRLGELGRLGRPILVGPSRKAFIGKVLGAEVDERLFGTAGAIALAVAAGAHIIRVHDVGPMRQVAAVAHSIRTEKLPGEESMGEKAR